MVPALGAGGYPTYGSACLGRVWGAPWLPQLHGTPVLADILGGSPPSAVRKIPQMMGRDPAGCGLGWGGGHKWLRLCVPNTKDKAMLPALWPSPWRQAPPPCFGSFSCIFLPLCNDRGELFLAGKIWGGGGGEVGGCCLSPQKQQPKSGCLPPQFLHHMETDLACFYIKKNLKK